MDNRFYLLLIPLIITIVLSELSINERTKFNKILFLIMSSFMSITLGFLLCFVLMTWNQMPMK